MKQITTGNTTEQLKKRVIELFDNRLDTFEKECAKLLTQERERIALQKKQFLAELRAESVDKKAQITNRIASNTLQVIRDAEQDMQYDVIEERLHRFMLDGDKHVSSATFISFAHTQIPSKGSLTAQNAKIVPKSFKGKVHIDKNVQGFIHEAKNIRIECTIPVLVEKKRERIHQMLYELICDESQGTYLPKGKARKKVKS